MNCPCCGATVRENTASLGRLRHLVLPPLQRRALDALLDVFPRGLTGEQIASEIYRDRADGGPTTARVAVSVYLHRIRKRIGPEGWTVGKNGVGAMRLSLVKEALKQAAANSGNSMPDVNQNIAGQR